MSTTCTDVAAILAAHGVSRAAAAATDANDGNRAAGKANEDVHVLYDDAEQTKLIGDSGVGSLHNVPVSICPSITILVKQRADALTFPTVLQH